MKWLILILLTKGNPLVLDHLPFETEDDCVAYVSDYNNAEEFAVEVIAHAGSVSYTHLTLPTKA